MAKNLQIVFLLFSITVIYGQDLYNNQQDNSNNLTLPQINNENNLQTKIPSSNVLNVDVDPDTYIVSAGDVFLIKIDPKGPAIRTFNSPVTPEGYIILPDIKAIYVRNKILKDANKIIKDRIKTKYKDAYVESYLFQLHDIFVRVLGSTQLTGKFNLKSYDHLYDAYKISEKNVLPDSTSKRLNKKISLRRVKLIRNNDSKEYDLQSFILTGNQDQNPILRNNDVIMFPFQDSLSQFIEVSGAVSNPQTFEFLNGDMLSNILKMSGGILPTADSSNIDIVRFVNNNNIKRTKIAYNNADHFRLYPDDRIYVRRKPEYHQKAEVQIIGEVKYPGYYAIINGKTKITELIKLAGGFTDKASLENAKVERFILHKKNNEFKYLEKQNIQELDKVEKSYVKLRARENSQIVSMNFNQLKDDSSHNVILHNGDIITIPKKTKNIFVSGGVHNPGAIELNNNWTIDDYINFAGGFSDRAMEGNIKIIKYKSGSWLDADDVDHIEENDIIFVPIRDDYNYWELFKDGLTVTSQIATIVLIYLNITK